MAEESLLIKLDLKKITVVFVQEVAATEITTTMTENGKNGNPI